MASGLNIKISDKDGNEHTIYLYADNDEVKIRILYNIKRD